MKQKPYRYLLYLGLRLVQGLAVLLPREAALLFARGVGRFAFLVARRERERTILHLTWVFENGKTPQEIYDLACRVFIHFAEAAVDVLRFPRLTQENISQLIVGSENLATFDRLLSERNGIILLTAHFGNWELMGAYLRLRGYQGAVVARRIYYEKFNQALIELRKSVNLRTIYQDAPARELLKALHQNEILGILADQDVDRLDGVFVQFFGRPTYTLTSPVKLALVTGSPIVPTFLLRRGKGYELLMGEPIRVQMKGSREETVQEYTAMWSRVLEEKIREYPDQWAWMHRRWKTQPMEEGSPVGVRI
ncbi:MAG: lysophospholipid acyltransferase family protein [Candidatus Omnitrophica bacterium]|nr:lysophospholipid acyltransferase family protein [Candidatus Omnitrophota bacterium]